jgi:predicted hydrocarbon binding protein/KaiC/GvpD/RAD55 family RecA-like ATPase
MEERGASLTQIAEVPTGSLILVTGAPGAGKSTFCHRVVLNGIATDRPIIFVTTEQSPSEIAELLREKGLGELPPGALSFVDAFAETVGLATPERADTLGANCEDLNSISVALAKLQQRVGRKDILLAFDSLTSPYLFNREEILRFIRLCLLRFAAEGNSVVALADEGCGRAEDLVAMMSVADGIITMEMGEKSRIIHVVKHPKVPPTKMETPIARSGLITLDRFDPGFAARLVEMGISGRGEPFRKEVGDFVHILWRDLAAWAGMLWDLKRFPRMTYEFSKQIEFLGAQEGLPVLPWHMRLLIKLLMPDDFSQPKNVRKFFRQHKSGMESRGQRIMRFMDGASETDEHHLEVREGYACWGLDNVGARLAFQDCGYVAGILKGFEKGDRDWNVVETKCLGLGDAYCEWKAVPGEIPEMKGFLEGLDTSIVEKIHDRLMDQLVGFLVRGRPLAGRPRLGSGVLFPLMFHVTYPSLLSDRYRMALRMGAAKAGKEVGEHLMDAGLEEDEVITRVIDFMNHCKVGKVTLRLGPSTLAGTGSGQALGETLRMKENCESFGLQTGEPSCSFTTGFLNGLFASVRGKHVREIKCIAAGDPYCEWEII